MLVNRNKALPGCQKAQGAQDLGARQENLHACVRVFEQSSVDSVRGGDHASACCLAFIEVSPRVAAVFPSPQEMTRCVSG